MTEEALRTQFRNFGLHIGISVDFKNFEEFRDYCKDILNSDKYEDTPYTMYAIDLLFDDDFVIRPGNIKIIEYPKYIEFDSNKRDKIKNFYLYMCEKYKDICEEWRGIHGEHVFGDWCRKHINGVSYSIEKIDNNIICRPDNMVITTKGRNIDSPHTVRPTKGRFGLMNLVDMITDVYYTVEKIHPMTRVLYSERDVEYIKASRGIFIIPKSGVNKDMIINGNKYYMPNIDKKEN